MSAQVLEQFSSFHPVSPSTCGPPNEWAQSGLPFCRGLGGLAEAMAFPARECIRPSASEHRESSREHFPGSSPDYSFLENQGRAPGTIHLRSDSTPHDIRACSTFSSSTSKPLLLGIPDHGLPVALTLSRPATPADASRRIPPALRGHTRLPGS